TAVGMRMASFLSSKLPQPLYPDQTMTTKQWESVSRGDKERFMRYVNAVNNPMQIFADLRSGKATPVQAETLKVCFPKLFAKAQPVAAASLPSRRRSRHHSTIFGSERKQDVRSTRSGSGSARPAAQDVPSWTGSAEGHRHRGERIVESVRPHLGELLQHGEVPGPLRDNQRRGRCELLVVLVRRPSWRSRQDGDRKRRDRRRVLSERAPAGREARRALPHPADERRSERTHLVQLREILMASRRPVSRQTRGRAPAVIGVAGGGGG